MVISTSMWLQAGVGPALASIGPPSGRYQIVVAAWDDWIQDMEYSMMEYVFIAKIYGGIYIYNRQHMYICICIYSGRPVELALSCRQHVIYRNTTQPL